MATTNNNNTDAASMVEMAAAAQKVSSSIPEGARNIMQSAKANVFDNDKLRSLSMFFGIGETGAYSFVLMPQTVCKRLWENLKFFYLNYVVLAGLVLTATLIGFLMTPTTLIILGCLGAAWFAVLKLTQEGIKVCGLTITRKEASAFMTVISGVIAFFAFQNVFLGSIICSSFLSFVHAWFRDASEHQLADANKAKPLDPEVEFK